MRNTQAVKVVETENKIFGSIFIHSEVITCTDFQFNWDKSFLIAAEWFSNN